MFFLIIPLNSFNLIYQFKKIFVNLENVFSDVSSIFYGVQQKYILGPLIFLIYAKLCADGSAILSFLYISSMHSLFFEVIMLRIAKSGKFKISMRKIKMILKS